MVNKEDYKWAFQDFNENIPIDDLIKFLIKERDLGATHVSAVRDSNITSFMTKKGS